MKSGYKLALFLFVTNALGAGRSGASYSLLTSHHGLDNITDQRGVNGITHHRARERRSAPLSAI
jgi:hypothetical protein